MIGGLCSSYAIEHAVQVVTVATWLCVGFLGFVAMLFAAKIAGWFSRGE